MADEPQQEREREQVLVIDGEEYDLGTDSLTFGEQRKVRRYVRELAEDPDLDLGDAALMDVLPAIVTVIKQRTDASFTPDQADAMRLEDVLRDKQEPGDPTPPQAASKRAAKSGGSGTPS
jgi:hypothetical protein